MRKKSQKAFRVWLTQVNQDIVDVKAANPEEAKEKAIRKWKRQNEPSIAYIQEQVETP